MAYPIITNPYKVNTTDPYIQSPTNPNASIPNVSYVAPKPITPSTITPTPQTNTYQAPVVKANTSDLLAQIESVKAQIAQKQEELKAAQAVKPPEQPVQPEQTTMEKMWASLMGKQTETQQAIQTSQQNLLDQQNAIYEKWGLTPENYQKIQDITTQITEYQKQMADLDTREAQALDITANRPGQDLAFMSGEQARISRAYAIQKSGIAANASVLASEAQALQGNWDNAFKSAQLYVDNATKAQQQVVSDLKWGYEQYSDIIQTMTKVEQDQINNAIKYQNDELDRQQTDYWKQVDADFKAQGLEVDWYNAQNKNYSDMSNLSPLDQLRLAQVEALTTPTAGQLVNATTGFPVKLTESQITDFQRYDQYINDLIPMATQLLDPNSPTKVSTGGAIGTWYQRIQNIPLAQRTLTEGQNQLMATIATMNNQLVYMLSGKQINEQEYERLKKQLPDMTLTNEQNMIRINLFNKLMTQARDKKMSLMGLTIAGDNTSAQEVQSGSIIEYNGKQYRVEENGDLTPQ